ncbi:unnamed protein product [Prunus armeniaca]
MLQGDMLRHEGAKGDTKLACCKVIWLGIGVPKVKGCRNMHRSAEGKGIPNRKLACCKAMWLDTGMPKAKGMSKTQSLMWPGTGC